MSSAHNPFAPSKNAGPTGIEIGLFISFAVVALYMYGFFASILSLPNTPSGLDGVHHIGGNLNLAKEESPEIDATPERLVKKLPPATEVIIPKTIWPASIANENNFETIIHPGDGKTTMSVPRLWSLPIHQGGLMSRETAMKIGSCAEPDAKGSHVRGEECPNDLRTIYLAIASYRDFQCRFTVESAFLRAKNPHRIRVGVVDQIIDGDDPPCNEPIEPCSTNPTQALCLYQDQIDVYKMEAQLSIGPVFARHLGHRIYRGEYYYTQSDAHVTYTQDWDADIISQMESTKNEMAVLTSYLTDVQGSIDENGKSLRDTRPIMCNTDYEGGNEAQHLRHGSQPERNPSIKGSPQMEPYWAAGYSFSRGHFVVNVPYDAFQPMIFQGEEMSIGIRGFTIGYDFYAPERSVCFHHYAVGNNAKVRNKVPHYWENARTYSGVGKKAMARLLGIVHMNPEIDSATWDHTDEELYGLGGVRTPEKFYETFGIDVVKKKTEHHLCRFVDWGGKMHTDFNKFLRPDGMGIDYSKITFRFKDPAPGEK